MRRGRGLLAGLAAIGLLVLAGLASRWARPLDGRWTVPSPRVAVLAGARSLLSDLAWLHLYARFEAGDPAGVLADVEFLAALRPDSDETRDFLAHWLAFGMVQAEPEPTRRPAWWQRGLALWLDGLRARPDSAVLHLGLGEALWIRRDDEAFRDAAAALLGESVRGAARRHLRAASRTNPLRVVAALFLLAVESWADPAEAASLLEDCQRALEPLADPGAAPGAEGVSLKVAVATYLELARIEARLATAAVSGAERSDLRRRRERLRRWVEGDENPFVVPRTGPR